jgi:hypothetical protein
MSPFKRAQPTAELFEFSGRDLSGPATRRTPKYFGARLSTSPGVKGGHFSDAGNSVSSKHRLRPARAYKLLFLLGRRYFFIAFRSRVYRICRRRRSDNLKITGRINLDGSLCITRNRGLYITR